MSSQANSNNIIMLDPHVRVRSFDLRFPIYKLAMNLDLGFCPWPARILGTVKRPPAW